MDSPNKYSTPASLLRDPLPPDRYTVLDNLRTTVLDLRQLPGSRENSLAITKVEEAIMWLEKV